VWRRLCRSRSFRHRSPFSRRSRQYEGKNLRSPAGKSSAGDLSYNLAIRPGGRSQIRLVRRCQAKARHYIKTTHLVQGCVVLAGLAATVQSASLKTEASLRGVNGLRLHGSNGKPFQIRQKCGQQAHGRKD
jgi:hypothetical protein